MSVNKVILVGNLGQDPELRTTGGGTAVCNLRIATNERTKKGGEWADHTEWHSVVVWAKMAENVAHHLSKGSQVYVEGRLRTTKWTDANNQDKWKTEVVADTVRFLSRNTRGDADFSAPPDDDIPF